MARGFLFAFYGFDAILYVYLNGGDLWEDYYGFFCIF